MEYTDDQAWLAGHRVSLIIPALNEAANIAQVFARIPSWVHEVVLVDGGSTDGTIEHARTVWPNRHVVVEERRRRVGQQPADGPERRGTGMTLRLVQQDRRGKGNALQTGILMATGDILILLDADGSTDPAEIPAFIGALLAGADFVKGSRFLQGAGTADMPAYRIWGNWGLLALTNCLFGTSYTDITYGYNGVWRKHVGVLAWDIDGWAHEIVNNIRAARHGLKVVEVACFEQARLAGEAKLHAFSAGWTILKAIFSERLKPLPPRVVLPAHPERLLSATPHGQNGHHRDEALVGARRPSAGLE